MPDYRSIYRTDDEHLRVPFGGLGLFARIEAIKTSAAEERAIANVAHFVFSVGILSRRLKEYIDAYSKDTWANVPIYELFLDTQVFFLFIQQFLEDMALVLRLSLPAGQRHQMPPPFSKLVPRLVQRVLEPTAPLTRFLSAEQHWFDEMKGLRDDILHRTAFNRQRSATFPDLVEVLQAGGGRSSFVRGTTLQGYLGGVLVRIFALACLAEEFVQKGIVGRYPNARLPLRCGILLWEGERELGVAQFGVGVPLYSMEAASQGAVEFLLRAGEDLEHP
jgi:hypothetical protein